MVHTAVENVQFTKDLQAHTSLCTAKQKKQGEKNLKNN